MTGPELREFRRSIGLSSRQFTRALGMPGSTDGAQVRNWEREVYPIPATVVTLVELIRAFPRTRDWLIERAVG